MSRPKPPKPPPEPRPARPEPGKTGGRPCSGEGRSVAGRARGGGPPPPEDESLDPAPHAANERRLVILACASVVVLSGIVFAPTLLHGFVWDDLEQVRDNEYLRHWSSFREFWLKDILALSRKGGEFHSNYYRPLFYVQYLLLYQAFGLNTLAWHAMAILVHALTSCAALVFVRRLGFGLGAAWMTALLFAVHPAHGESVSWIAAAFNDPPAAAFLMLGLTAHIAWLRGKGGAAMLGLGLLGFAAALCLKESGLSMLLLVPLVTWFVAPERRWRGIASGLAPYAGVAVVYFLVRALTIGTAFGIYEHAKPVAELLPTFPLLALFYVRLLTWPLHLSPSYPLRHVPGWGDVQAWGSLLALCVLGAGLLLLTRRTRVLRFGALWIVCCIWPVFNIRSFLPTYLAHQRYLYLASLGLCIAVAWLLSRHVRARGVRLSILTAVLAVWSASNLYHDRFWASDLALWTRISEVDPHNPAGFDWRGGRAMDAARAAVSAGRAGEAARFVEEAEALFRGSIEADPGSPYGYQNMAVLLHTRRNKPEQALPFYEKAIERFAARQPEQLDNLVKARGDRAACLAALGRRDEALRELTALAEAPPYPSEAAENAAVLHFQANRPDLVKETLARALARRPDEPRLLRKMAELAIMVGRPDEGVEPAKRLVSVVPDDPAARALLRRIEAAVAARRD